MYTLNCKGRLLLIDQPIIMGIINLTPDSFFKESRIKSVDQALATAEKMLADGATILDVGGQSTRPGSERISSDEERARVVHVIAALKQKFPEAFISVDTYYADVAKESVDAGADIINDISAGSLDARMIMAVAALKVPYVLMHMKGTPASMQSEAVYENVTGEVLDFFIKKKQQLNEQGITDIIIDPGFGFAKTISHNFRLLKDLGIFKMLEKPILLGISRKSLVYKTLGTDAANALNGTTVLNTIGLVNGAAILRVHDVKEAAEAVKLFSGLGPK
jgi:dihydropteroate synthase